MFETVINIDEHKNITGGFAGAKLTDDGLKLPCGFKVYAYVVCGEKLKPFNPCITLCSDGDVLKLPTTKKALSISVLYWR